MDCIFCKIITGEAESSKVYEDDEVLAFMNIQPINPGEVLVVPKEHIDHFSDIPENLATRIFQQAHKVSQIIRREFQPERVGLVIHGYGVSHAHMIVVPQDDADDITSGKCAYIKDGRVAFSSKNIPVVSRGELNRQADIIAREMKH